MTAELEAVCLQLKSSTIYVYFSTFEFTQVLLAVKLVGTDVETV